MVYDLHVTKIFLDLGAHIGESLEIAMKSKYSFDRLLEIEPSSHARKILKKYRDSRIEILPIGFGSNDKKVILYGAGSVGASIHYDKTPWWSKNETVQIVKFSTWYKSNIKKTDLVYLKINIEGAENEIIDEILLLKDFEIQSVLISFDVEKVPSLKEMKNELNDKLNSFKGIKLWRERTKDFQVEEWLDGQTELGKKPTLKEKFIELMGLKLPFSRSLRKLARPLFPKQIWLYLAIKFGPNRKR